MHRTASRYVFRELKAERKQFQNKPRGPKQAEKFRVRDDFVVMHERR